MKFIVDRMPETALYECPFHSGDSFCKLDGGYCKGHSGAVTCQGLITFEAYMKGGSIPCSVGDAVYGLTGLLEWVREITITESGVQIKTDQDCYSPSDIGKKVFLTEAEAMAEAVTPLYPV